MTPIRVNRRHFLSASAAAGLALSQGAAGAEPRPLRIGLVGVGNRGTTLLRTALELPGIEIAAVADPDPRALRRACGICQRAGRDAPESHDDPTPLLARDDLAAVLVAVPCDLHAPLAISAIQSGKPLYLEKPLASSLMECDAVLAAAASRPDLPIHVGFQRRSNPRIREAVSLIRSGEIGELVGCRGHWLSSNGPVAGHDGWLASRARSGDWMVEQAVHIWDLLSWTLGGPPQVASGHGQRGVFADREQARDVTDWYSVLLRWEVPPLSASFLHSWAEAADGDPGGAGLKIVGTRGSVELHSGTVNYRDGRPRRVLHPGVVPDTRLALAAFFEAVRAPEPPAPPVSLTEAREATRIGLMVREAVDVGMGRVVTLDEITA